MTFDHAIIKPYFDLCCIYTSHNYMYVSESTVVLSM